MLGIYTTPKASHNIFINSNTECQDFYDGKGYDVQVSKLPCTDYLEIGVTEMREIVRCESWKRPLSLFFAVNNHLFMVRSGKVKEIFVKFFHAEKVNICVGRRVETTTEAATTAASTTVPMKIISPKNNDVIFFSLLGVFLFVLLVILAVFFIYKAKKVSSACVLNCD